MTEDDEPHARPITPFTAGLWTFGAQILSVLFMSMAESFRPGASSDIVTLGAAEGAAYGLALFGILRVHDPEGSIRSACGLGSTPRPAVLLLGLLLGPAIYCVSDLIDRPLTGRFPSTAREIEAMEKLTDVSTSGKRAALVVVLLFVLPAVEEFFFRGLLLTQLRRRFRGFAPVVSLTMLFVLLRADPRHVLSSTLLAFSMALLAVAGRSSAAAWMSRMAYFSVAVVPLALRGHEPTPSKTLIWASFAVIGLALPWLYLAARRDLTPAEAQITSG